MSSWQIVNRQVYMPSVTATLSYSFSHAYHVVRFVCTIKWGLCRFDCDWGHQEATQCVQACGLPHCTIIGSLLLISYKYKSSLELTCCIYRPVGITAWLRSCNTHLHTQYEILGFPWLFLWIGFAMDSHYVNSAWLAESHSWCGVVLGVYHTFLTNFFAQAAIYVWSWKIPFSLKVQRLRSLSLPTKEAHMVEYSFEHLSQHNAFPTMRSSSSSTHWLGTITHGVRCREMSAWIPRHNQWDLLGLWIFQLSPSVTEIRVIWIVIY